MLYCNLSLTLYPLYSTRLRVILEGRLPKQHRVRPYILATQPQPTTLPERDIKGEDLG
jgi:hypothetical protein